MVSHLRDLLVAFASDRDCDTVARLHLLNVGQNLFKRAAGFEDRMGLWWPRQPTDCCRSAHWVRVSFRRQGSLPHGCRRVLSVQALPLGGSENGYRGRDIESPSTCEGPLLEIHRADCSSESLLFDAECRPGNPSACGNDLTYTAWIESGKALPQGGSANSAAVSSNPISAMNPAYNPETGTAPPVPG